MVVVWWNGMFLFWKILFRRVGKEIQKLFEMFLLTGMNGVVDGGGGGLLKPNFISDFNNLFIS